MLFKKYSFIKNKETYTLILLILFSISIRVPVTIIYGDTGLEYEWKFLKYDPSCYFNAPNIPANPVPNPNAVCKGSALGV